MTFIREVNNQLRGLGQKLSAQNIQHFGQKVMDTSRVIGRKASNTLRKIEDIGHKALPIVNTIATMAGYPELGALAKAGEGLKRISNFRGNLDTVRKMVNEQ